MGLFDRLRQAMTGDHPAVMQVRTPPPVPSAPRSPRAEPVWLAFGMAAQVGRHLVPGGMFYVGTPRPERHHLGSGVEVIDPTLPVGRQIVEKLRAVMPAVGRAEARDRVIDLLGAVRIPSPRSRFDDYPSQFSGAAVSETVTHEVVERRLARLGYWGTLARVRYAEAFAVEGGAGLLLAPEVL